MRYILFAIVFLSFGSCTEEPHLKHNLAFTKIANICASGVWNYKLISNTNGERYEFNACLAQNYNGAYNVTKRGDTLVVDIPADTSQLQSALYKMVLDVDAWPKYSHIYLGSQLLKVGSK